MLNAAMVGPPQGDHWTKSLVYNLKLRKGWHRCKPVNQRNHSDEEVNGECASCATAERPTAALPIF